MHNLKPQRKTLQHRTISRLYVVKKKKGKERKMTKNKETKEISIPPLALDTITVHIVGDSDLILNKMDERTKQDQLDKQSNRPKNKAPHNEWEDLATRLHWLNPIEKVTSEEEFNDLFETNVPCISEFGLNKSFAATVIRFKLDKNSTAWNATVKVAAENGKVPIAFKERFVDEKLIPTNTISKVPVRAVQNRFRGWEADLKIQIADCGAFSIEQVMQVIGYAGFGIGIGSARSSGNGRYHITEARVG